MILNETVLTVALPSIMADYAVTVEAGQWLTTGFLLTMAVVIPMTDYLLQRFTLRALFVFALRSFLVGLLLAVVAPAFSVLLAARIIQAIGTAIVLPLLMSTTLTLVPVQHRGTVMGLSSIVIAVGPAIGPTVSGIIVDSLSWRWIFGVMTPLAAVILVLGIIFIKMPSATRKLPVDVLSAALSAFAFGGLVYAISTFGKVLDSPARQHRDRHDGLRDGHERCRTLRVRRRIRPGRRAVPRRPYGLHHRWNPRDDRRRLGSVHQGSEARSVIVSHDADWSPVS